MLSQKSFKSYLHKVLKSSQPDTNIGKKAIDCSDAILRIVATRVSSNAHLLTQGTEKKTLSSREVRSATKLVLPQVLADKAVDFATKATEMFSKSKPQNKETVETKTKPQMRETKAGLTFSVSLAEKYIRNFGQIKYNISSLAPVFLAAVLENVTVQMLKVMSEQCASANRKNITVRHVFLALNTEPSFLEFVKREGVVILGGGVLPNVHESLLNKTKKPLRKRKETETGVENSSTLPDGTKRPHRWRPGTVALRNIRMYQKREDLLIQNAPFERIVRKLAGKENNLRFTHEFMIAFQHLCENDVVTLLNGANSLAIHASRETVQPSDIKLYAELLGHAPLEGEAPDSIPVAAINKMSYRAGIKRLSLEAKKVCQNFICNIVKRYISFIVVCTLHNRRRTVNTKFLLEGLRMCGVTLATVQRNASFAKVKTRKQKLQQK